MEFSFTSEPGIVLIKHLSTLIPSGADMYVYFSISGSRLMRADYKNSELSIKEITDDDELSLIIELRKPRKNPYSWELQADKLKSVLSESKKTIQFDISNEDDHVVLSMRFNSVHDKENDVVYISFRTDLGIFGIEAGRISMNTENKTIIANLLYKSCVSVIKTAQSDLTAFNEFTVKTKHAIDSVKIYKERLKQLTEEHHKNTVMLAQNFISGLSVKYNKSFVFTDECINFLRNFSSDLPRLQSIVEKAAIYAYNLNSAQNTQIITIEEEYLEYTDSDTNIKNELKIGKKSIIENDHVRVDIFLNRLENAVKRTIANKEKTIGNNVCMYMEPAISSAAITLFLKKYIKSVNDIFNEDPSKFPQSRKHFKPLQNVILSSTKLVNSG
ncbi:MAG: hypothetical protein PHH30_03560 [Bacteroidales bacterium]|nr:hypothetical protein [Bacteroidales bacterium]MDD3860432.1 hypothetical protein [Bacteroidales bacterium]